MGSEFSFGKILLYIVLGAVALWVGFKVVGIAIGLLWSVVLPLAVFAGVGYLVYRAVRPKALPGGGRGLS
ncbi:MAG: hypothetical protein KF884_05545 [Fimbriimonadaceae bacterium]|nr:hypothetical protein [Fimbriimonadaceae bacterium]QYK59549.1 MAG: hypothetical protein KF884_05545 [Fimbriimonadaceae bacterium]